MNSPQAFRTGTAPGPVGRLLRYLKARFAPAPIGTPETLRVFLEQRAFFIAQKCAIDYCRGKTGLASHALFTEKPFLEALDVCRWETFATVLGDLLIMVEGRLRPHVAAEEQSRLCDALVRLYPAILGSMPCPAHRGQGWDDVVAAHGPRLRAAGLRKPQGALDVADHSARRLFDTLPIHETMRALDEEVVYGAVRFRMIALGQEMQRRFSHEELAKRLLQ